MFLYGSILASGPPPNFAVIVDPTNQQLCWNEDFTIKATGSPTGGTYSWSTSDANIANWSWPPGVFPWTHPNAATVAAVNDGQATITVTYTLNGFNVNASCQVTVVDAQIASLTWKGYQANDGKTNLDLDPVLTSPQRMRIFPGRNHPMGDHLVFDGRVETYDDEQPIS